MNEVTLKLTVIQMAIILDGLDRLIAYEAGKIVDYWDNQTMVDVSLKRINERKELKNLIINKYKEEKDVTEVEDKS